MSRRILFVDPIPTNRIIYKVRLAEAFFQPELAADAHKCLAACARNTPDLIILSLALTDIEGPVLIAELRASARFQNIPIIALAPPDTPEETRISAWRAGADAVLSQPLDDSLLLARARGLLRARADEGMVATAWGTEASAVLGFNEAQNGFETAGDVILIAARPETALVWKHQLQSRLRDRLFIMTPEQALTLAPSTMGGPDIFLIEANLDNNPGSGLALLPQLFSLPATRHSAICMVIPDAQSPEASKAFDQGAADVVASDFNASELQYRLRRLLVRKRRGDRLRKTVEKGLRLAMVDPLTGTYNRRYAIPRLAGMAAKADAEDTQLAVFVLDLDRFKTVNDHYGHATGDEVLVQVAARLAENLRMNDLLARLGGEEFLVAVADCTADEAAALGERLRQIIEDTPVVGPNGQDINVTISVGITVSHNNRAADVPVLIDRADQALLTAKACGRNRVVLADGSLGHENPKGPLYQWGNGRGLQASSRAS